MAGERTVKIKFTGESSGVAKAAASAERAVKKMGDNVTKGVAGFGEKITGALSSAIEALPPQGKVLAVTLGAGLAAALAPVIGAAISSAVLVGVGGGLLAAGIKAAAADPRVKSAFGELKKTAQAAFRDYGKPFVEPLIRAAGTLKATVEKTLGPALQRIGKMLAPVIDKLAPALAEFFKRAIPGVEAAVKASVPLFQTLADKLPLIGEAINYFFSKIASQGPQANEFWGDMLDLIAGFIVLMGDVIAKLASFYVKTKQVLTQSGEAWVQLKLGVYRQLEGILDAASRALGWMPIWGDKIRGAQAKFRDLRIQANNELNKIRDRTVRINAWSNVASAVQEIGRQLDSIPGASPRKRRASGGPVSAGRSYLVGERGPEIVTMQGNGYVTPNREIGAGGDVYELHLHLADEVTKVIRLNNRDLKRRATARRATA